MSLQRPGSLAAWLSRGLALLWLVGLGTVCVVVYAATAWSLTKRQDHELEGKRSVVEHLLEETRTLSEIDSLRHDLRHYFAAHPNLHLLLRRPDGSTLFATDARPLGGGTRKVRFSAAWALERTGRIEAELTADTIEDDLLLRQLALVILATAAVGTAAASASAYWLVKKSFAPVRHLAHQTRSLSADDLSVRLSGSGQPEELQPLISQFNSLLSRLERAYLQLEGFNADVAHELRTPLTTLIGQSELALGRPRSAEELRDVIASNLEELQRLSAIVNDVLFLAHADRGAKARRTQVDSLAAVVSGVAEFHDASLGERQLSLQMKGDATAAVDVGLFQRAASNLLSNATRYATPNSTIEVTLRPSGEEVSLEVTNNGAGIPLDQLPLIFNRFHRTERSRSSGEQHHGLGLAIVAAIARMHDGNTFAHSIDGRTSVGMFIRST